MRIQFSHSYEEIVSLENLFLAWKEFIAGKSKRVDVQVFAWHLMDNIVTLREDLSRRTYRHGGYEDFCICDPKPRHIHKASVRDRLVHHAIYRVLYPFFDRTFIADSFSCRNNKGVHKALDRFRDVAGKVSRNHTRTAWVLKLDIQKFFASIDHDILVEILVRRILDQETRCLLQEVIGSFVTDSGQARMTNFGVGLPLGNLTSQLFANVYLNEFDQWVKHELKAQWYIRYADDMVMFSDDREWLASRISQIRDILWERLQLTLHPKKISLSTFASGVDFLGWVHFPDHRVLRTTTKKRMMRRIQAHPTEETLSSYLGLLSHGNAVKNSHKLLQAHWLSQ